MSIENGGDFIIVVEHINKTFANGVKAVVDFTTKIRRGEVVVVIGPSGSGKSTFLRCLNGLEEIDNGSIVIDGIPSVLLVVYAVLEVAMGLWGVRILVGTQSEP